MTRTSLSRLKRAPGDRCQPPPQNLTYPPCNNVGNDVITCYPTRTTTIQQDIWTRVVWNINHPRLTQLGAIDVYLYSADSNIIVANWTNVQTSQGFVASCTDDMWLAGAGAKAFDGQPVPWRFQWLLVQTGHVPNGGEQREDPFTVVQSRLLDSQLDAAAASSSSLGSANPAATTSPAGQTSSSTLFSTISGTTVSISTGADGKPTAIPIPPVLQPNSSGNSFPHWAIALLAVLGFFALLGFLFFAFFMCRDFRERRRRRHHARRESMGSESPMMAAIGAPTSPQSPAAALLASGAGGTGAAQGGGRGSFPRSYRHDASSTTSHTDSGPFSGADAAFIANAFRDTLRRPDFKDRPLEEGESPEALPEKAAPPEVVMSRELAEEGRDIRSVRSERGVKVESLIDHDS
ncbi:hypothetical protein EXIGLDRAFT_760670 [Exidia glandulosa HHB12029]|uniref:Uncharacterized protein n=1 Tax=Exidia glandulosa HHB12029 TaxID=1314781 RepID=A0A165P062_EXIGL|nr:hypothetical protein EXIGLDRAFT_760670 [Exidia glandulosa HHB12029]